MDHTERGEGSKEKNKLYSVFRGGSSVWVCPQWVDTVVEDR